MSYLKLIKLLYLADREALLRWGRPITTDRFVSMERGPVLSRLLDLVSDGDDKLHAVLCSKACPGDKIIEAIDLAQRWRTENRAVISGFHTPVEKECLRIFLRGPQRIVICPARGLDPFLLPAEWQQKFKRGEMLIISLIDSSIRRPTKETAELRNRLVVDLSTDVTIIHASPGGHLEQLTKAQAY